MTLRVLGEPVVDARERLASLERDGDDNTRSSLARGEALPRPRPRGDRLLSDA